MKTRLLLLALSSQLLFQTTEAAKPKHGKLSGRTNHHQSSIGFNKTSTEYLPQLTLRNWWDSDMNDWTLYSDTSHNIYNSKGLLIQTSSQYSKSIMTYDAKGHETSRYFLSWNFSTETWDSSSKQTSTYDAKGNETSSMYAHYVDNAWAIDEASRTTNVYNGLGQLSQSTMEEWVSDNIYENSERINFTYNSAGEPIEAEIMEWNEITEEFVKTQRLVNIEWHQWTNDVELSQLAKLDIYIWADSLYVLVGRDVYTYDSHNNETEYYSETWDGTNWTKDGGNKQLITYNSNGAMTEQINQWFDQDSGVYLNQMKETFSDFITFNTGLQNQVSQSAQVAVYPNPANSAITIELSNTAVSETISFYNLMGQTVLSNNLKSGMNTIDVSVLPKGIYIYKTQTGTSGKLVVE